VKEVKEQEVYMGEIPLMTTTGSFVVNGTERVIVSQLHRSPGVDFVMAEESASSDRKTHSCRIIPERGSWIELLVSKRDAIGVRIDQSGKFSALTLLRAMSREHSTDAQIIRLFYNVTTLKLSARTTVKEVMGHYSVDDVVYPPKHDRAGEILVDAGSEISETIAEEMLAAGLKSLEVIQAEDVKDHLILKTLAEDGTSTHEEALLKIYQRLRPGNPPNLDKAIDLFREKFFDVNRYRLGRVGRFRINRKFQQEISDDQMTLDPLDYINAMKYIVRLRLGDDSAQIDDIDNLGNRRLRTIDELAADEIRKGFLKLRRTVQERMSVKEGDSMTPRTLINPKSVSAAIDYFYGRSELSQVVDQTNPLSMLTHERRLSALGPGGLNRKRAGFEVRDVHISHYGRICPVETPEGTNIGLISSLSIYSRVDDYGFLISPYRVVRDSQVTDEVVWLRADEEASAYVCPADTVEEAGQIAEDRVLARNKSDVVWIDRSEVQYIDVAPCQMVGVSAGLIPFLEHDDANRALMGSNMQRQAVPLLIAERPVVGTGMEPFVAQNSGMVLRAPKSGKVTYVDANVVEVDGRRFPFRKFIRLNERTCLNQKPIVRVGDKVKAGQVLCDSAATKNGSLALGRNVLVAFMSWEGYNFEDAIILSERLVKEDVYTSIHLDEFDVEIRETKLGREEFTRDIPNVSEKALRHLDDSGIIKVGTRVNPGDILVGKVSPKAKSELTPEEKLLHAIFGRAGEDVKNESLEVPSGVSGIVIHTERFSRRMSLSEVERKKFEDELKRVEKEAETAIAEAFKAFLGEFEAALEQQVTDEEGRALVKHDDTRVVADLARRFQSYFEEMDIRSPQKKTAARRVLRDNWVHVEDVIDREDHRVNSMKRGDELPSGVLQMVKVYVASRRQISVGDKMAGRHGNKGVISKVLPIEDMPFLEDGTPVDIILNPLGVPSRMNVGQILETHLGWAA